MRERGPSAACRRQAQPSHSVRAFRCEPVALPAVRAANSSAQLQTQTPGALLPTQLPGALLTVGGGGPPAGGGGGSPATSIRIQGYASSAPLLRSNIVVCSAVLHVVGGVLLVRRGRAWGMGGWVGRAGGQGRLCCPRACWAPCPLPCHRRGLPACPPAGETQPCHSLASVPLHPRPQPSAPLSTVVPYTVAVEGLSPSAVEAGVPAPAAVAAPAAEAAAPPAGAGAPTGAGVPAAQAPAAEVPAAEAVRAALAAERERDAATLKSESLAAAAAAPAVEAASGGGTTLPANATLNATTTAATFTPADCPANPLIALG